MPPRPQDLFATLGSLFIGSSIALAQGNPSYVGSVTSGLDRWMYPFGPTGPRSTASLFTTIGDPNYVGQFDDRDGEYLLGFDTSTLVPAGLPWYKYQVVAASLKISVFLEDGAAGFTFDPTSDPVASYLPEGSAGRVADPDDGRPIELFACGYRGTNGSTGQAWGPMTFGQSSPFSTEPCTGFGRGCRSVYPVDFDQTGAPRDVSNNVTGGVRFDPHPLAVGQASVNGQPLATGATVPSGAVYSFSVDVSDASIRRYVQEGLSAGRLNLIVSSLHASAAFGSGPVVYPVFATRYNPLATAPALTLDVRVCPADIADGVGDPLPGSGFNPGVDGGDFDCFFNFYFEPAPMNSVCDIADGSGDPLPSTGFNPGVDGGDFDCFFNYYFLGCP